MPDAPSPNPSPAPSPLDLLPLWLRDWRVFVALLLVLILGGPEVRDGVKSLLGLAPSSPAAQSCCDTMGPRIQALEDSMRRNDEAHRRIISLLSRGIPAPAAVPAPRDDRIPTSARAAEVPAP